MSIWHADDRVTVHHGDCLDVLQTLPDCSVDSVVTDPPAGVSFMGREWDTDKGGRDAWVAWLASVLAECRRIHKPGGHALVWALPRTSGWTHRAIEDAGLDVRDGITHLFGSGFPKSLDVGKAIDRAAYAVSLWDEIRSHIREWRDRSDMTNPQLNAALGLATNGAGMARHWTSEIGGQHSIPSKAMWLRLKALLGWPDCDLDAVYAAVKDGADRPVLGARRGLAGSGFGNVGHGLTSDANAVLVTAPATEGAARWDGWGTALKPSSEMWYLARRPLTGTVAQTVLAHGTGALNIAATRVATDWETDPTRRGWQGRKAPDNGMWGAGNVRAEHSQPNTAGRWPSNVVLSHSPSDPEDGCEPSCPVAELDAQSGTLHGAGASRPAKRLADPAGMFALSGDGQRYGDSGSASRFFPVFRYQAKAPTRERPKVDGVAHETVKPLSLMIWLAKLVTPPGGVILDPFGGSGTTAEAALAAGFRCITIEREERYLPLILARIRRQQPVEEPRPAAQQMSLLDEGAA